MKKILTLALAALLCVSLFAGCAGTTDDSGATTTAPATDAPTTADTGAADHAITVISREEGSGTRGAFIELFGIEQKDASGTKVDYTTEDAEITNSTSVMMTTVAGNEYAIGYISLGSLNDTVKAVMIDGAEATVENIKSGEYGISRPFNIVYFEDNLSELASDFIAFIMSDDGQAVVNDNGYISMDATGAYSGSSPSGTLAIGGSSSVYPVMEKLVEAYEAVNPNADIQLQQSDSTTGVSSTIDGTLDIGMASRELKDEELSAGVTSMVIATDGIAVIVNLDNSIDNLTKDQVLGIYTGEITNWSELG